MGEKGFKKAAEAMRIKRPTSGEGGGPEWTKALSQRVTIRKQMI